MSQLVTGEAVALDLRPAALPSRFVAGMVDGALQLVLLLVLGGLAAAVQPQLTGAAAAALGIVVLVVVLLGYPVTFETLLRGRTPGKAVMGLRVVRDDGGPIGFRQALVRGLAGGFLERPGITLFAAGVVTMLLNAQSKRLGDLLAGTVVVRERVPVRGGAVAVMPPQLADWAGSLDLSGLSDELALSVRQFLARSDQLTATAREDLGGRLLAAVLGAVRPPPPPGAPGGAVLSAVLAERRRREEQRLSARTPRGSAVPDPAPGGSSPVTAYGDQAGVRAADPAAPTEDPPREQPPAAGPGGFVAPS
jgi:uncharacterized RDD family membrane protein YckC